MTGSAPDPKGEPQRVLVVDDVPEVRSFVRFLLEERGYLVDEASDGEEAVDVCDKQAYDLVLMDIVMPKMNGIEACREILSSHPERPPPRVIMLTAYDDHGLILDSLKAGALGYILKPVAGDFFVEAVESLLGRSLPP